MGFSYNVCDAVSDFIQASALNSSIQMFKQRIITIILQLLFKIKTLI